MQIVRSTMATAAAAALATVAGALPAVAAGYKIDPASSSIEFTAVGKPGFLHINGTGGKLDGTAAVTPAGATGTFTSKLDDFETGIDMRNEHMKTKYLETGKFPTAKLEWTTTKSVAESGEVPFTGKLTLHGVTKPVTGTAKLDPSADKKKVGVDATFTIKLPDYNIDIPKYLGVTVAEDVDVHAKFDATGG